MAESTGKPKSGRVSRAGGKAKPAAKVAQTPNAGAKVRRPAKSGGKARPGAGEPKPVKLLSGGNPQIAKADGDAPVQAYIAAMPDWKRDIGTRLDSLIVR